MAKVELSVLFLVLLFFVTSIDAGSYCSLYSSSGYYYYYKYCDGGCCGSGSSVYCCDYDVDVGLIIGLVFVGLLIFSCIVCVVICVVIKQKHYGRVFHTPGAQSGHLTGVTVDSHTTSGHMYSHTNVTTTSGQFPAPPSYSATYLPPPTQPGYTVPQQNYPPPPPYSYGPAPAYNH